jgi:hypothetical protein
LIGGEETIVSWVYLFVAAKAEMKRMAKASHTDANSDAKNTVFFSWSVTGASRERAEG